MAAPSDKAMSSDDESSFEDIDHRRSSIASDESLEVIENVGETPSIAATTPVSDEPWALALPPYLLHKTELTLEMALTLDAKMLDQMYCPIDNYPPWAIASDEQKRAEIQWHLSLLLHASNCYNQNCMLPHCSTMKEVLNHNQWCTNTINDCHYAHCSSSSLLMHHWKYCGQRDECWLCVPAKKRRMEEFAVRAAAWKEARESEKTKRSGKVRKEKRSVKKSVADLKKSNDEKREAEDAKVEDSPVSAIKEKNHATFNEYLKGIKGEVEMLKKQHMLKWILLAGHIYISAVASPGSIHAFLIWLLMHLVSAGATFMCVSRISPSSIILHLLIWGLDGLWLRATTTSFAELFAFWKCVILLVSTLFSLFEYLIKTSFSDNLSERLSHESTDSKTTTQTSETAPEAKHIAPVTAVTENKRFITLPSSKLGVLLMSEGHQSVIFHIIPNEAAEEQGELRRGDVIERVNGFNVANKNVSSESGARYVAMLVKRLEGPITLQVRNNGKYLEGVDKHLLPSILTELVAI